MARVDPCFESREELVIALREAVTLEMTLMIQYLYAAYSIPNYQTGLAYVEQGIWTPEILRLMCGDGEQRLKQGLRGEIVRVANEEMIHFLLANNLLMSVGGHFYVPSPDFASAQNCCGLPAGLCLEAVSLGCLERFVALEAPAPRQAAAAPLAHPLKYASVSDLYWQIRNTFAAHPEFILVRPGETGGEHHLFLPEKTNKYHPDFQCQVDCQASALFAIDTLTEQGEGSAPEDESYERSHWRRFQRLRDALGELEVEHGRIVCYPCVANPTQYGRTGMTQITNPATLEVLRVFNASFELSMQMMLQHFCIKPRATLRRSPLMNASIDVMSYFLAPLGVLLMCLDSGTPGKTAGPSFELAHPLQFIPDHEVAKRLFSRRFRELRAIADHNRLIPADVTKLLGDYAEYSELLN